MCAKIKKWFDVSIFSYLESLQSSNFPYQITFQVLRNVKWKLKCRGLKSLFGRKILFHIEMTNDTIYSLTMKLFPGKRNRENFFSEEMSPKTTTGHVYKLRKFQHKFMTNFRKKLRPSRPWTLSEHKLKIPRISNMTKKYVSHGKKIEKKSRPFHLFSPITSNDRGEGQIWAKPIFQPWLNADIEKNTTPNPLILRQTRIAERRTQ